MFGRLGVDFWSIFSRFLDIWLKNVRPSLAVGDPNLQKGGPAGIILLKLQGWFLFVFSFFVRAQKPGVLGKPMPKDKCMFCYIARMGVDWRNHMKYSTVRTFASYHERMLYYFPNRCWRLFGPQGFHLGRVNRAWSVLEASTVLYSTVQHCTVLYSTVEAPRSEKKRGTKAIRSAIHSRSRL